MFAKRITYLTIILTIFSVNVACEEKEPSSELIPEIESSKLIPTPIDILKWQIDSCVRVVENFINTQLAILNSIRSLVTSIVQTSVDKTLRMIDSLFLGTITSVRRVTQKIIDKGINITECTVQNIDKFTSLRRRLIVDEIECVTAQAGEFYEIIDGAIHNFTSDLLIILELPARFQKCFLTLLPLKCFAKLGLDVAALQTNIPTQILGTMDEILHYFNDFKSRVISCQSDQLGKAYNGTGAIINELKGCIRITGGDNITSDPEIMEELDNLTSITTQW